MDEPLIQILKSCLLLAVTLLALNKTIFWALYGESFKETNPFPQEVNGLVHCKISSFTVSRQYTCADYEYCCANGSCCTQTYALWYMWVIMFLLIVGCCLFGFWYKKWRYRFQTVTPRAPQVQNTIVVTESSHITTVTLGQRVDPPPYSQVAIINGLDPNKEQPPPYPGGGTTIIAPAPIRTPSPIVPPPLRTNGPNIHIHSNNLTNTANACNIPDITNQQQQQPPEQHVHEPSHTQPAISIPQQQQSQQNELHVQQTQQYPQAQQSNNANVNNSIVIESVSNGNFQ